MGGISQRRVALCCVFMVSVAVMRHANANDNVDVVPLGESADKDLYPPGLDGEGAGDTPEEMEAERAASDATANENEDDAPAPIDPWGKEATTWRDHMRASVEAGVDIPESTAKRMSAKLDSKSRDDDEDVKPDADTLDAPTSFSTRKARDAALKKSPYDIVSKISPVNFEIVVPAERPNPREDETANALSGRDEKKFTEMITGMEGETMKGSSDDAGDVAEGNEATESEDKLIEETKGAAYMEAEDTEEKKLRIKRLEEAAKKDAVNNAIAIKAQALSEEHKDAASNAAEHMKADEAKRDEDIKAEKSAEDASGKGWLKPKLAAELVLEQKNRITKDDKRLKRDRQHEIDLKSEARMSDKEKRVHRAKHKDLFKGKQAADAANDKEMAMKFVRQEFERRKKTAYQQHLNDVDLENKMRFTGELMAKKDAAKENMAKSKESTQKGKDGEKREKKESQEQEQKLVAAAHKPKPTNCKVSPWKPWDACSRPCSGGVASRTRTVIKAQLNNGADCPALTQSKPCNTQPCLSVTFTSGYCDKALQECTKARAMMKGCKSSSPSTERAPGFGDATGMENDMVSEQMKVDQEINADQQKNDDNDEEDEEEVPDDSDEAVVNQPGDDPNESTVERMKATKSGVETSDIVNQAGPGKHTTNHRQVTPPADKPTASAATHTAQPTVRQADQPAVRHTPQPATRKVTQPVAKRTAQPPVRHATQHESAEEELREDDSLSEELKRIEGTSTHSTRKQHPTADVHFKFHHSQTSTQSEILKAVSAAEHAITNKEGAAATKYTFKMTPGPRTAIGAELGDLGEAVSLMDVSSPADVETSGGSQVQAPMQAEKEIHETVNPKAAKHTARQTASDVAQAKKVFKGEEESNCGKFKDSVAHYCGQMVDCVTKSLDTEDIKYSQELTKRVVRASHGEAFEEEDDQAAKHEADENEDADRSTQDRVEGMIPPTRDELRDEEVIFKMSSADASSDSKLQRNLVNRLIGNPPAAKPTADMAGLPGAAAKMQALLADHEKPNPKATHANKQHVAAGPEQKEGAGLFPGLQHGHQRGER